MKFKEFATADEIRNFINENKDDIGKYHPFTAILLDISDLQHRIFSDKDLINIWSGVCRIDAYFSNIELLNTTISSFLAIFKTVRKTIGIARSSISYMNFMEITEYIEALRDEYPYFDAIYEIINGASIKNNIVNYAIHRDTITDAKNTPFKHFISEIVNGSIYKTTSSQDEQMYADMIKTMNRVDEYFKLGVYHEKSVKLLMDMIDDLKELIWNVIKLSSRKSEEGMPDIIKDKCIDLLAEEYFKEDNEFKKLLRGYIQ